MQTKTVEIINKLGLHARAAAKLSQTCSQYGSAINIQCKGQDVDGKSIMSLMLLAASKGTDLTISCEGSDELIALNAISELIANYFGEEQ